MEKPIFDPEAAEEHITEMCINAKNAKEEVFKKDNMRRDRFDFYYSDQYYRLQGEEIAYRKVLAYFAQFDL